MKKSEKLFKTEAEMCAKLIEAARAAGFKVYPETSNWDVVLAREGLQFGVEAKLRPSLEVLSQALPPPGFRHLMQEPKTGPHFRCVAVPRVSKPFRHIAMISKLIVLMPNHLGEFNLERLRHPVPAFRWAPQSPLWLPDFEPECEAGVPHPRVISRWKVQACKLSLLLERQGYITSADAKLFGINLSTWKMRWIIPSGKIGRLTRYIAVEGGEPLPHIAFPEAMPREGYEEDLKVEEYEYFDGSLVKETEKAVLVELDGDEHWIPKSVLEDQDWDALAGVDTNFGVQKWWAKKEGLI